MAAARRIPADLLAAGPQPRIVTYKTIEDVNLDMHIIQPARGGKDRPAIVWCDLKLYEGRGHGFHNWRAAAANPMFNETVREMDRFLVSLGWLDGEPSIDTFVYGGPAATED